MWDIIYALQLSKLEDLWPGTKNTPENSIGKIWCVYRNFNVAALRFHNVDNMNSMCLQTNIITPVKGYSSTPSPPKKTKRVLKKNQSSLK